MRIWPILLIGVVLLTGTTATAEDSEFVTNKVQNSVDKALTYLKRTQNSDGSWGSDENVAVTGLACLAFMGDGNLPGRGKYGVCVDRGIKFLLKQVDPSTGFIGRSGWAQMYGHGFATLCLAEAYGMAPNPDMRVKLNRAIKCILSSQKSDGGWRYDASRAGSSDLSLTVCQLMALRAANNAGIAVPKEVIARAIRYTKQSANSDGGFRYMLAGGGSYSSFSLTAAGVTVLFGAGEYNSNEVKRGLEYLKRNFEAQSGQRYGNYFYGHYYAVQAAYQAGDKYWDWWYPKIREELLRAQLADGSWSSEVSNAYGAAMAALILEVPFNYLPIFQH